MPFSGRLNGVPPLSLASPLALNGVLPSTAVSWMVIQRASTSRPYVWRSRTSCDVMAASASLLLNTMSPGVRPRPDREHLELAAGLQVGLVVRHEAIDEAVRLPRVTEAGGDGAIPAANVLDDPE